jgi:hypothetical protein
MCLRQMLERGGGRRRIGVVAEERGAGCNVDETFSGRHRLDDDFEVIPTPGHTSGATADLWDTGEHRCPIARLVRLVASGMEFRPKAPGKFVPLTVPLRLSAFFLPFGVAAVAVGFARSDLGALVDVLFFLSTAVPICVFSAFFFFRQRRRLAAPLTHLPADAEILSTRRIAWRILFVLAIFSASVIVLEVESRGEGVVMGGVFIGTVTANLWHARWIERTAGGRGESWFSESRPRWKPRYFARELR